MINAEHISEILYNNDPANTACVENEAFDEYDRVSETVYEMLSIEMMSTHYAVRNALYESFGPLDNMDTEAIDRSINEIDEHDNA